MITLDINSEYGQLKDVILASIENYHITEPINITQEKYYFSSPPQIDSLLQEQKAFVNVLQSAGVNIHWATLIKDCPYQVNTRDIAAVIGTTLVVGRTKKDLRRSEINGIKPLFPQLNGDILIVRETTFLEGGDILLDGKSIYVGLGERTDLGGFEYIESKFADKYEITPLKLKKGILHLDVVFNILPGGTCIVDLDAFTEVSARFFNSRFDTVILVDDVEQFDLATNVFALNPSQVVADKRNSQVNNKLKQLGLEVIELDFTNTSKIGGAFRCATLPLQRT